MPVDAIVTELLRAIQSEIARSADEDLSKKEQRAIEIGRLAARMSLSEMLKTGEEEPVTTYCRCGGEAKSRESQTRSIVTLAGTHQIRRRKYRCKACGEWIVPRDESLGIGAGNYSVGVIALTSEVAAGFSFGASEDFLSRRFGLDMCYKQVQRLSERTGEHLGESEYDLATDVVADKVKLLPHERPTRLTISADGLMVFADGAWTEMKCASYISKEHGRSTIATMERAAKFGDLLYLESVRRGVEVADEVVFVADGAPWIWNLVAHHFKNAVEIVDWYHATEHLWRVARAWYGEDNPRAKRWVKDNQTRLMEDGVDRVIQSINQWKPSDEQGQKIKHDNLNYFRTNANRMLYASFEVNGFNIGSGSVESACKQYGQGRLKGPGMRWKRDGIESIAHIRSALLNKRTDNILQAARKAA